MCNTITRTIWKIFQHAFGVQGVVPNNERLYQLH